MDLHVVPIHAVHVSPKKIRKLHPKKIQQYEYDYERGDHFPPIEVEDCGTFYTVRDGRHRYIAQLNLGYTMIDVVVVRSNAGVPAIPAHPQPPCELGRLLAGCRTGSRLVGAFYTQHDKIIAGAQRTVFEVTCFGLTANTLTNIFGFVRKFCNHAVVEYI